MGAHNILNGFVSLIAASVLAYVVLSTRWDEGLLVKSGLIVMILSLLATAALTLMGGPPNWAALWNAGTALRCGIVTVVVGYWWRGRAKSHPMRRSTDWGDLDEAPIRRPWA